MKQKLLSLLLLALWYLPLGAQNFYVYQGSEVTRSDVRYMNTTKFVVRIFIFKDPSSSSQTVYVPRFTYDYSYDSSKLSNPEYYVMHDSIRVLGDSAPYSLSQGIYTITPGIDTNYNGTAVDDSDVVIHHNVSITSTNNCVNGMTGASFSGGLYAYEIFRVYFDLIASNPPPLSSLVYKDPGYTNYVVDLGPGGSAAPPGIDPVAPLSPPWLIWPYTSISDASPTWQKCNNLSTGNGSVWNSTDIGGMVLGFGIPLPVRMARLGIATEKDHVLLTWQTLSETNNNYFDIERSADKKHWSVIGRVFAQGNSSEVHNYEYRDRRPLYGVAYYRLKQTDLNGTQVYSPAISTDFSTIYEELHIYPNPAAGTIQITGAEPVDIVISDARGIVVLNTKQVINSNIDISGFSGGLYYVQLTNAAGKIYNRVLVVEHTK